MGVREDLLKRLRLPELQISRIDPLIVMPRGAEVLKTRRIPGPASLLPTPAPVPPVAAPAVD